MIEEFREIPDFERYFVSNLGRVYDSKTNKFLGYKPDKNGYLRVVLRHKNNKVYYRFVHRLVAMLFIGNPNNYLIINHKDENKTNNIVSNLEWCDYRYNSNYGAIQTKRRISCKNHIVCYCKDKYIICASSRIASKLLKIDNSQISKAVKSKKYYADVYWRYANNQEITDCGSNTYITNCSFETKFDGYRYYIKLI